MGIVLDTPLVHKSFTSVLQKITPDAHIYDNPNQQGTKIPAWFIVHREPVTIERDLDKRAWLTYGIDLYYMLDYNLPRTFDSYSSVADALNTELKYLTIYGTTFKVHVQNRSWSLQLDCLRYSTTLKFRVSETEEPETKMQVIEDLAVFLKNQPPEPPFYDITVEPSENGHVETDRDKAQKGRVVTFTPYPDKDYMLQTIRVMCGARNIPVTDNSFIMPDGPVSIYSEFVEAPVAVLWRFFDDREPEPIMGYRYIHNLSKAKPIDHGEAHVLDVSTSVFSKGKPIDHGEVEVITPEMVPMMAARMIDHGAVSVLDVELDRIVEPIPPEPSELPSVTEYSGSLNRNVSNGDTFDTGKTYESTKVYMIATGDNTGTTRDVNYWRPIESSGKVFAQNNRGQTLHVYGWGMVATDSTYVTAINVYKNSNNVAYPTFKYTYYRYVYYWVWDGEHQYWTDDLSSVGYHL